MSNTMNESPYRTSEESIESLKDRIKQLEKSEREYKELVAAYKCDLKFWKDKFGNETRIKITSVVVSVIISTVGFIINKIGDINPFTVSLMVSTLIVSCVFLFREISV